MQTNSPRRSATPRLLLTAALIAACATAAPVPPRGAIAEDRELLRDVTRDALPSPAPKRSLPKSGVLFHDDFSRDSLGEWHTERPGVWSIRRGMLRGDLPDRKQQHAIITAGDPSWTDYAVDVDVCMMRGVDKGVVVRTNGRAGIGVDLRGPGYYDVLLQQGWRLLGKARVINGNGVWHHLRIEARGHTYTVYVNGERLIEKEDRLASAPAGAIALPAYTGGVGQCTVYYDNVVVTALPPAARER